MSRRSKTQTRIVVANEDWSVRSMPWQLVADGSSFYLHPERALYKVSLHGPRSEDWSQAHMRVDYLQGQLGNPSGPDAPNKKHYDPRIWLRAGEVSFVDRLKLSFAELHNVNTLG